MILHHVAQGAGFRVVVGAALHTDILGYRDLDVVDKVVAPHGTEQRVTETHRQQVLYGLLAEVVVDAPQNICAQTPDVYSRNEYEPNVKRARLHSDDVNLLLLNAAASEPALNTK